MLDSNIVAVSLPSIARSLGATFTDIEWVVSAYVLPFAALLLAAGAYADRHGRKRATLLGLGVFTVASALCGLATSAFMLNLARALQGIGASLLLTASLAVINHAFAGPERAKAYAFWGACLGIAITGGPIGGGVITDLFGWRWAFLVNVPSGVALFVTAAIVIAESRDHDAKRLDLVGILTFSAGLFLLIWALIDGNSLGWGTAAIFWRLAGAAALLTAFVFVELRQQRPMVDFALFKQPTFLGAACAMLGYAGGAQVLIFFLPLFLQNAYGFAPARGGVGDAVLGTHAADAWSGDDAPGRSAALRLRADRNDLCRVHHRDAGRRCGRRPAEQRDGHSDAERRAGATGWDGVWSLGDHPFYGTAPGSRRPGRRAVGQCRTPLRDGRRRVGCGPGYCGRGGKAGRLR
jgi:EmrB/QacA subfamily drug resistance transporter